MINLLELTKKQVLVISALTVIVGIMAMVSVYVYAGQASKTATDYEYKADQTADFENYGLPRNVIIEDEAAVKPQHKPAAPGTTTNPHRAEKPAQAAPAQPEQAKQERSGAPVGSNTETAKKAFDDSNCQYPGRKTNTNGCDNSDPCDPTTLKDPELTGDCRN